MTIERVDERINLHFGVAGKTTPPRGPVYRLPALIPILVLLERSRRPC